MLRVNIRATYALYKFYLPAVKLFIDETFKNLADSYVQYVLYEHYVPPFLSNLEYPPSKKCALSIQFHPAAFVF